mgnify:CR=1 FL=1
MAAGVAIQTASSFLPLLQKNLADLALGQYYEKQEWKQVFKEESFDTSFSKRFQISRRIIPLGPMAQWATLASRDPDNYKMGPAKQLNINRYGMQVAFDRDVVMDKMYDVTTSVAKDSGYSANLTIEFDAATLLDNATATTYYTSGEGEALVSDSHAVYGEGATSADNKIAGALSYSAVQDGMVLASQMVNDRGYPLPQVPTRLLVPTVLMNTAKVIVKTPYKPGTDANDISTVFNELTYDINHYMTQSTYWFLVCDKHDVHLKFREQFNTDTWQDPNTGTLFYLAQQRYLTGFNDWRGWYGSVGS